MTHLIKLIIELLTLILLYLIARKQNKQGGRISVLEERDYETRKINARSKKTTLPEFTPISNDLSFSSKITAEENRMKGICKSCGMDLESGLYVKKVAEKKSRNRPLFPNGYKKGVK